MADSSAEATTRESAQGQFFAAVQGSGTSTTSNGSGKPGKPTKPTVGTLKLSWVTPTQNDDGTALADLKGYTVLLGSSSGRYDKSFSVSDPKAIQYSVEGISLGTYYVVIKSVNLDGVESMPSQEVVRTVQ